MSAAESAAWLDKQISNVRPLDQPNPGLDREAGAKFLPARRFELRMQRVLVEPRACLLPPVRAVRQRG
jgi:hypothetical protein